MSAKDVTDTLSGIQQNDEAIRANFTSLKSRTTWYF